MTRPTRPILSPDAPRLSINNNSCHNIDTVLIDGATQLTGIGAGDVGNFHMDDRCHHHVDGVSGEVKWSSDIQCQGNPYHSYDLNWIFSPQESASESLPDGALIVETHLNNYYGEIEITGKSDCRTIIKIVANRDNCKVGTPEPNRALKFGDTLSIPYFCSRLLELNVATDHGSNVFVFDAR
jgi:hypothetical protein